jgi:hypothetical protein
MTSDGTFPHEYVKAYLEVTHGIPGGMSDLTIPDTDPPKPHDPLCMPGLKHEDSTGCNWCSIIRLVRKDERARVQAETTKKDKP